jgi:hypothetical protein
MPLPASDAGPGRHPGVARPCRQPRALRCGLVSLGGPNHTEGTPHGLGPGQRGRRVTGVAPTHIGRAERRNDCPKWAISRMLPASEASILGLSEAAGPEPGGHRASEGGTSAATRSTAAALRGSTPGCVARAGPCRERSVRCPGRLGRHLPRRRARERVRGRGHDLHPRRPCHRSGRQPVRRPGHEHPRALPLPAWQPERPRHAWQQPRPRLHDGNGGLVRGQLCRLPGRHRHHLRPHRRSDLAVR